VPLGAGDELGGGEGVVGSTGSGTRILRGTVRPIVKGTSETLLFAFGPRRKASEEVGSKSDAWSGDALVAGSVRGALAASLAAHHSSALSLTAARAPPTLLATRASPLRQN